MTDRHTLKIKSVPRDRLKIRNGSARTHSKRQIEGLAASIKAFGLTGPIACDENYEIVCGHARHAALILLGWQTIPAIRLTGLTLRQKRALALADNKHALNAGWDNKLLAIELQALLDVNFKIELTGFATPEIDAIAGYGGIRIAGVL